MILGSQAVHILILYASLALAGGALALVWKRMKQQSRSTADMLNELGLTYEGQWKEWETRQQEMERTTSELLLARDQQEALLGRNISNRSMRQEALGLLRAGMQPDSISTRLELPRNEVRLLAKVQSILRDSASAN